MPKLQALYIQSQSIHDACWTLERKMNRIKGRGHKCVKTLSRWYELYDELRTIESQMALIDG